MKFNLPRILSGAFIALALLLPAVLAPVATAAAGYVPGAGFLNNIHLPPVDASQPKLESHLATLAAQHAGAAPVPFAAPRMQSLGVFNNSVRVVVQATSSSTVGAARNAVTAAGGRIEQTYADLVQAVVPTSALTPLAQSPAVSQVRQPAQMLKTSLATDEGVAVSQADIWHASGITGEGVKVAIIDGGFADLSAEQSADALPSSLTTVDDCPGVVSGTTDFSSGPHGTAVAEIVHAMAPQAQLTLICAETPVELGVAEQYAVANGIQIINASLGFYGTSRGDGNGPAGSPEATVADASAHGILWVNAAGNAATDHWSGVMNPNSNGFNLFAPGDDGNVLTIPPADQVCVVVKWDAWTGANYPMTAFFADPSTLNVFEEGVGGVSGGKPVANVCAINNSITPLTVVVGIYDGIPGEVTNFGVFPKPRVDLVVETEDAAVTLQHTTPDGSIMEPATSPSALAVGATCFRDNSLEFYSSRGPTIDGRIKPDLVAPDATSSDIYGPSSGCTGGFTGTSAAAPHVAGAAALAMQELKTSSADPRQILESTALDLGPNGPDNSFGAGELRLPVAVRQAPPVFDGTRFSVEQRFTNQRDTLSANWLPVFFGFTGSQLATTTQGFQVAFGTSPGAADVVPFTTVTNSESFTATGLHLIEGAKYFATVRAMDSMGILSPPGMSAGVTVDLTPPTLAMVSPTNNANTNSRTLTATASDTASGVASVQFQRTADGGASWLNIDSPTSVLSGTNTYTILASTNGLPDGTQTVRAQAMDGAGNVSTSPQVSFSLNTTVSSRSGNGGNHGNSNAGGSKNSSSGVTTQQTGGAGGSAPSPNVAAPIAPAAPVVPAPAIVTTTDQLMPSVQPPAVAASDVSVAGASTPSIALSPVTLSTSIDGTQGGTLASDDGSIQLQVPAGVSSDTSLTVSLLDATGPTAPPVNFTIGSLLVNVVVQDSAGNMLTSFDPPLALTVRPLASDGDPTALQVTALDPMSNTFVAVPFTVNADGTLTVSVAALGIAPTVSPPGDQSVGAAIEVDSTDAPAT